MWPFIKTFCRHLFTGKDNYTYSLGRFMWAWAVASVILSGQYQLWQHFDKFNILQYAQALALALAAGGGAVAAMSATKSDPEKPGDAP